MITVDNNDIVGIEQLGQPEELDFYDVEACLTLDDMFPWLEDEDREEVELLVADVRRLREQSQAIAMLVPATADKIKKQATDLIAAVEKKIVKLVQYHIHYRETLAA